VSPRHSLSVGSSTSTATSHVGREVVDLSVSSLPCWMYTDKLTFSQFLSATIGPPVALVSAPRHTPSSSPESPPPNLSPTIVVPVDVAGMSYGTRLRTSLTAASQLPQLCTEIRRG